MLLNGYKEYLLSERVRVKKEIIYNFLSAGISSLISDQAPIFDYIMRKDNILTIIKIEHNQKSLLPPLFSFFECDGYLYYGQFTKCFPTLYIFDQDDFKD